MGELRREQPLADGKLDGIEGRDDRGEDRDDDKQQDHPPPMMMRGLRNAARQRAPAGSASPSSAGTSIGS